MGKEDFKPGQTKELNPNAPDTEALTIFYETLYQQRPDSEMAQRFLVQHGLLPEDEAKKLVKVLGVKAKSSSGGGSSGGGKTKKPAADDDDDFTSKPKAKAKSKPPPKKIAQDDDSSDEEAFAKRRRPRSQPHRSGNLSRRTTIHQRMTCRSRRNKRRSDEWSAGEITPFRERGPPSWYLVLYARQCSHLYACD